MDIKNLPIADTPLSEMNDAFEGLQRGYEGLFLRYISLHKWDEYTRIEMTYKEAMKQTAQSSEEEFEHPKFMREFMGTGVLPSFNHLVHQAQLQTQGKTASGSRVGLVLSTFHHVMRNAGKLWGTYFDKDSELIPEALKEMITYFERVDDVEKKVFDTNSAGEKRNVTQEEMLKKIDALDRPECLKGLSYKQVSEKLTEEFSKLEKVPLKINGETKVINNTFCIWSRREYFDADHIDYHYSTPISALVFGIRHGGNNILGRPEESPMRQFLQNTLGVAMAAGRKIEFLHNTEPEIFKDYDREFIAKNFVEQRYWIRTARACAMIQDKNGGGFAKVLELIGKDPDKITFESASKIAVLLYATSEVLEKKVPEINKEMITAIRTLAAEMYRLSEATEKDLTEAKRKARSMDALEGVTPENETEKRTEYYQALKNAIIENQRVGLQPLMQDAQNIATIKAFAGVVDKNIGIFPEKAKQYVIHAKEYCTEWVGTATSPITGAVSGLQEGRKASNPEITKE